MYTPERRAQLRHQLLEFASKDGRISGAAITGSAAEDREDPWSDIDLAFGITGSGRVPSVLSDWTRHMYDGHGALHHLDIRSGAWIYRVFLLSDTLQVDLAFVPAKDFRALSPAFRLVFGEAGDPQHLPSPAPADLIGFGWLYAVHARTCIARQQLWQGEYMISGLRNNALALACLRYGLPAVHGRGLDQLPSANATHFSGAFVSRLEIPELTRAFRVALEGLLREIQHVDGGLAHRLQQAFSVLTTDVR